MSGWGAMTVKISTTTFSSRVNLTPLSPSIRSPNLDINNHITFLIYLKNQVYSLNIDTQRMAIPENNNDTVAKKFVGGLAVFYSRSPQTANQEKTGKRQSSFVPKNTSKKVVYNVLCLKSISPIGYSTGINLGRS